VLETPRLLLRPLTTADRAAYAALLSDAEVMRYIGGPLDADNAARQLDGIIGRFAVDRLGPLAVELREDERLLGRVGFWIWDRRDWTGGHTVRELRDDAEIELGWILARRAWGHGYATEAAVAVLRHAYGELGLSRVISLIDPRNDGSVRVAERLGARHETDVTTPRWGALRLYRHAPPTG
jgi:RimJ/RimL family protein N-acetyltransferase